MKLLGKVAIVTGASRGIGRDIAVELAKNGANVVVNYSKDEIGAEETLKEIKDNGNFAIKVKADVGDYDDSERLVDEAVKTFGKLDIIINNAGRSTVGLFMDSTKDDIDGLIRTNLLGAMYMAKHGIKYMLSNGGSIVNISSMWGEVGASCEVVYSTSKGGMNLFTKSLAKEMAPSNIRVNCVAPGVINTKMNSFLTDEDKEDLENEIPMGRFGEGSEIAKCVLFLCSEDSSYITGQVIRIDGGMI